jgi:hypothetical protein
MIRRGDALSPLSSFLFFPSLLPFLSISIESP